MSRRQPPVETILVHVPFAIRKYGGRKRVITPNGEAAAIEKSSVDSTLVKALARAFRWKKMLESGQYTTITELAEHENLALTYMTRVLRLSLLAPEMVEAILDGRQSPEMTLAVLLEPFPVAWQGQSDIFRLAPPGISSKYPRARNSSESTLKILTSGHSLTRNLTELALFRRQQGEAHGRATASTSLEH